MRVNGGEQRAVPGMQGGDRGQQQRGKLDHRTVLPGEPVEVFERAVNRYLAPGEGGRDGAV